MKEVIMVDIKYSIILFLLCLLLSLVGIMFFRGKWLRLLSGNLRGDTPENNAKEIARFSSIALFISALICLILSIYLIILPHIK
ncbi:hypothetical protein [Enterococcus gilvus]|uniref:hypothetical protein n=1 Tax=Enterococcus gilvus TaxID=160453 RepID=UPI0028D515C1|nr:hypothetical protein [Enterococcus gilvus]